MGQDADGTAHFAYYRKDQLLAYVWDGSSKDIEISYGGFGEEKIQVISAEPLLVIRDYPEEIAADFKAICDAHADSED